MKEWFTVEKIDEETFVISEYKHWEQTHCYLVIGENKALLIDTGLGIGNIKKVVDDLTSLLVLVITTHVHWDHIGGHKYFRDILVHKEERGWIEESFPIPLVVVKANLLKEPCDFPKNFDIKKYTIFQGKPKRLVKDGDIIDLGNRKLKFMVLNSIF